MKKFFLLTWMVLFGVSLSFSQTTGERQILEEEKVLFNPHWFVHVQGGAAYTAGESGFSKLISPAVAFSIGYQFNPVVGLSFGGGFWQGKGGLKDVTTYTYKFDQLQLDGIFNLSNLFTGFNPKRFVDVYALLGVGFNHAFDNDEATAMGKKGTVMPNLWTNVHNSFVGRGGLGLKFRLSDYVEFTLEANANGLSDRFNSAEDGAIDWHFNGLAGVCIRFGKKYKIKEAVYYEPEPIAITAPVVVEEKPVPVEVKEEPKPVKAEPMVQYIFFDLDKTFIRDDQRPKLDELIEYLRANPETKVSIVGYADKETGNPRINLRLSIGRAANVKAVLTAHGISESRIITDAKGDTVRPFAEQIKNRVSICIAE